MITSGKHKIVTSVLDLPELPDRVQNLYLDFETTSYDPEETSLNPWGKCWILGIAITWDDHDTAYYLPLGHRGGGNLPEAKVLTWLYRLLQRTRRWVNSNIKYDAHVLCNTDERFLKVVNRIRLYDTATQSKLVNSDRFTYSEAALAKDWLGVDVSPWKDAFAPYTKNSKDWGVVPIRLMGPYACEDVLVVRRIHKHIEANTPVQCQEVANTEIDVTSVLFDVERAGMQINEEQCQKAKLRNLSIMEQIMEMIERDHGLMIRPNVNADCYEIFHERYGLPVVQETEKGQPSYDKDALKTLVLYPDAPVELLNLVLMYRTTSTLQSLFVETYLNLHVDGVLHPDYNQCVKTGRMSCRRPNAQQLSSAAKALILAPKGYTLLSLDYSSIEFRLLAHYLNQPEILRAYQENPNVDFHEWVATMCGISRKAAKNVNFCMAYGGGKQKVLSMLASNDDIIKDLTAEVDIDSVEDFEYFCQARAGEVFSQYHRTLYRLRPLTQEAARRAKKRGYVYNAHGRRRHLPAKAAFRGLNSVIQSGAADVQKEAAVALSPRFNERVRNAGVRLIGLVHDELLFAVPNEEMSPDLAAYIRDVMVAPQHRFNVPLTASVQKSEKNWQNLENYPISGVDIAAAT